MASNDETTSMLNVIFQIPLHQQIHLISSSFNPLMQIVLKIGNLICSISQKFSLKNISNIKSFLWRSPNLAVIWIWMLFLDFFEWLVFAFHLHSSLINQNSDMTWLWNRVIATKYVASIFIPMVSNSISFNCYVFYSVFQKHL